MIIKHQLATHGIANKGFSGLRSSVFRFKFCNGGQERSPQSLTSHTAGTLGVSCGNKNTFLLNRTNIMRKIQIILVFIVSCLSNCNASESAIICGKIHNSNQILDLRIQNFLATYPSYNLRLKTDSLGNFKIKVPVVGLTQLWLSDIRQDGIPIFINKGDSIHLEYDLGIRTFPDYLENVSFSGKYEIIQSPYTLFKNGYALQDSVHFNKKRLSPNDFRKFCELESKKEEERLIKELSIKAKPSFVLEFNRIFWVNQLFTYTFPSREYKGSYLDYSKYLDSLGYFTFLDSLTLENEDIIFCDGFGQLIRHIFNYAWITGEIKSKYSTDLEQLDYIQGNFTGLVQQGLLSFHIFQNLKFKNNEERRVIINKYITNQKMNAAFFQEQISGKTLEHLIDKLN